MDRRTVLQHAGIGMATVVSATLAGCGSSDDTTADGGDTTTALPELQLSEQALRSDVDGLAVASQSVELTRGQQHDDVHFAVTLTVENTGDQAVDLGDYDYEITLYDGQDDITPGNTWAANGQAVPAGETGTVLVQVSFLGANVGPSDVTRYALVVGCGESGAYC